jgi:hypothetical protein
MLRSMTAIWDSVSAPTAEHLRRPPRTAGDREVKQNRPFIGALVEQHLARIKRSSIQKTASDLQQRWCATLGLNLEPRRSSRVRSQLFLAVGVLTAVVTLSQ